MKVKTKIHESAAKSGRTKTTKTVKSGRLTRREYNLKKAQLENRRLEISEKAATMREIGSTLKSGARTTTGGVVAGKGVDAMTAKEVADKLNPYYEVISGNPEASGDSQSGSTTDINASKGSRMR